ncbi:LysM peptidoglycan-binding domain-containing protein [Arenimonas sp. MALMAid1274]|uniref:LysM peptidoglycan-binding domain-containing protein n=1 Tax=Arenimonas sp. MALMAid1274 TaxID=3411630 RepID=UPI003B9E8386
MTTPPKKADFSNVQAKVTSTEAPRADFSNVQSSVTSTEQPLEGGGGGGTLDQQYTVEKGDTLSHIAKRFYGKASKWPDIFAANRDQLSDPDRIRPGQVLRIPAADAPAE